jgi:hypothetical protein
MWVLPGLWGMDGWGRKQSVKYITKIWNDFISCILSTNDYLVFSRKLRNNFVDSTNNYFIPILGDSTAPKNDDGPIEFVQRTTSVFSVWTLVPLGVPPNEMGHFKLVLGFPGIDLGSKDFSVRYPFGNCLIRFCRRTRQHDRLLSRGWGDRTKSCSLVP